jgi:hypothetical protein
VDLVQIGKAEQGKHGTEDDRALLPGKDGSGCSSRRSGART